MFTETELREALEDSASRADDIDPLAARPAPRRAWPLPIMAAATVVAIAVGAVAFVQSSDRDASPAAAAPLAAVDLVVRAVAEVDAQYNYEDANVRAAGGQHISRDLGRDATDGTVVLAVLPATFVDPDQVRRGQRVSIAGTTGWLARRTSYKLDGQAGAAPGQDDPLPQWTIAFLTPGGDWAFARIDSVAPSKERDGTYDQTTIRYPARIVAAYNGLRISFDRVAARQPLRFSSLPAGLGCRRPTTTSGRDASSPNNCVSHTAARAPSR